MFGFLALSFVCLRIDVDAQKIATFYGQKVTLSGVLSQDIIQKDGTYRAVISSPSLNYSISASKSQAYLVLNRAPDNLARSDNITVEGILKKGFGDYEGFMYRPRLVSFGKPSPPDLAAQARAGFSTALRASLDNDEVSNLALGYLVGEKGKMSEDFVAQLKRIGMTHAVVASGFHLGVLINFAKKYLKKISRLCALLGSLIFLMLFIAVAGFSPSLVRAGIVTVLSLFA